MLPDWIELCKLLGVHRADYLLVGGQAVIAHGYPRLTKDMDLWVRPTASNGSKEEAWSSRIHVTLDDVELPVIDKAELIKNKRAGGRLQDLADAEELEKLDA